MTGYTSTQWPPTHGQEPHGAGTSCVTIPNPHTLNLGLAVKGKRYKFLEVAQKMLCKRKILFFCGTFKNIEALWSAANVFALIAEKFD